MSKDITTLFSKYLNNNCDKQEVSQLLEYFEVDENTSLLRDLIRKELEKHEKADARTAAIIRNVDQRLTSNIRTIPLQFSNKKRKSLKRKTRIYAWTAGLAAAVLIGAMLIQLQDKGTARIVEDQQYGYKNDVLPGTDQAQLILSDGRSVQLGTETESLEEQDGTDILGENGLLVYGGGTAHANGRGYGDGTEYGNSTIGQDRGYGDGAGNRTGEPLMNTLIVPNAGTYRVVLPDGTKVWLNASSELRYPVRFSDEERKVYLKGEAYFDVARNPAKPFKVEVNGSSVEALGTAFNIRAYEVESVSTTLIEGVVRVASDTEKRVLSPGQLAILNEKGISVEQAVVEQVTAWKDGYFYFKKESFFEVMKDIARWYDIDLHYTNGKQDLSNSFTGSVDRNAKLSQVLEMLREVSDAEFEIDGDQLYIDLNSNNK